MADLTPLEDFELVLRRVMEKRPYTPGMTLLKYICDEIETLQRERSKIHNAQRKGRRSKPNPQDTGSGKDRVG